MRDQIRAIRSEAEVFADLSALCRSDGTCMRSHISVSATIIVGYAEELRPEDTARLLSPGVLFAPKSTLIGLMIHAEVNWEEPSAEFIQQQIEGRSLDPVPIEAAPARRGS
jgi:hypothetical protein